MKFATNSSLKFECAAAALHAFPLDLCWVPKGFATNLMALIDSLHTIYALSTRDGQRYLRGVLAVCATLVHTARPYKLYCAVKVRVDMWAMMLSVCMCIASRYIHTLVRLLWVGGGCIDGVVTSAASVVGTDTVGLDGVGGGRTRQRHNGVGGEVVENCAFPSMPNRTVCASVSSFVYVCLCASRRPRRDSGNIARPAVVITLRRHLPASTG